MPVRACGRHLVLLTAVWAPMAVVALGGALVAAAAEFGGGTSPRLIALYPPWWTPERALAAAAAAEPVVGVRAAGRAVAVVAVGPGAAEALRRGGAWFVADGAAFPACFSFARTSK